MDDPSKSFLDRLLTTPSPSGFERPIQDVVREFESEGVATKVEETGKVFLVD